MFLQSFAGGSESFSAISHQTTYPADATLFVEGQNLRGVFLLCSGKVKRSTRSRDGKVLILKMAGPGEMLGPERRDLGDGIRTHRRDCGAVPGELRAARPLLDLLQWHGEAGLRSAQALSREFQSAYCDIHDLILARSSAGKLVKLLLSWTPTSANTTQEIRVCPGLTHEEMAQMIGASREIARRWKR